MPSAPITTAQPPRRTLLKLLAAAPLSAFAGPYQQVSRDANPRVSAAALRSDVDLLARAMREVHPGLLRYQSAAEFERRLAALRAELNGDRPLPAVFLALSRFTATVQCGHTWVSHFNQSKAVRTTLVEAGPRLPFWFEWVDGRMVITRDGGPDPLPPGTEVLVVDGTPAATLLETLLPHTRADGGNRVKRVSQLGVRGDSTYEAFDVLYPWVFDRRRDRFTLRVRRPGDSRAETCAVEAITHAQRFAPIASREQALRSAAPDVPLFDWQDDVDGAAWLRMSSWAMYNTKWDWRGWLHAKFEGLAARSAPALVIDLRGNEGGDDVGDVILEHLVDRDISVGTLRRLVRYRALPAELPREALDTWNDRFRNWGDEARELDQPWPTAPAGVRYLALADEGSRIVRPAASRFTGKVVVLVDAVNSSATFLFAQVVQQLRLGTLVGEPTGGNRRGINGGGYFFLRLPGSGLEVDLPLIGYFPPDTQPDAGLVPDVAVSRTIQDIAAGRDPARAAVATLLGRRVG